MEREVAWKKYDEAASAEVEALAADYINFISDNKTERECVLRPPLPQPRTPATTRWPIASPPARPWDRQQAVGLRPGASHPRARGGRADLRG